MNKQIKNFFYLLLFTPIWGYIYIAVFGLPKNILYFYSFVILFVGLLFILNKKEIYVPKFARLLILYTIYRLFWLFLAENTYHPLTFFYYLTHNITLVLLIIIIYNTKFGISFINNISIVIGYVIIITAIVSFIQVLDFDFLNPWSYYDIEHLAEGDLYSVRRVSIFGFIAPTALGLSFLPMASVYIGNSFLRKDKSLLFYLVLIGLVAFFSNTRYIMISFIIITFHFLAFYKIRLKFIIKYLFYISISILVIIYIFDRVGYSLIDWYQNRLFVEGDITKSTRWGAMLTFAEFFPDKPIFGTGVHLTEEIRKASLNIHSSQIHVGYLSHLVSYGIVGSILLFGFWFNLARKFFLTAKLTNYWGSFFAFMIFLWAQVTLVNYSFLFVGLIIALIFDKYYHDLYKHKMLLNAKDNYFSSHT